MLLKDHESRGSALCVPHTGDQKDRFLGAIRERNLRMRRAGQPEWAHYCERCTQKYLDDNGRWRKLYIFYC